MAEIGAIIAEKRKALNLSQATLGRKLDCTSQAVTQWESGKNTPSVPMLVALADVFGCSVDELLGRERKGA